MKKKELKRKLKQQEIVTRLLISKLKAQNSIKTELSKMQVPNDEDSLEQRIKFFDQIEEVNKNLENQDNQINAQQKLFQEQLEVEQKRMRKKIKKINAYCESNCTMMKSDIEDLREELETELAHRDKELEYLNTIVRYLAYKQNISSPASSLKEVLKSCKKDFEKRQKRISCDMN